jgi:sarcosine oxidase subunit beta
MNRTADAVIIGGGIIGSSIAYYLAKEGGKVIVVDRKPGLCFGASGANQGGCPVQLFEPPVLALAVESLKLYQGLSDELGYDIEYDASASLLCSVDEAQYPVMKRHARRIRESGLDVRLIGGDEIRKLEPILGEDIIAGVEDRSSAVVNPFKVTYGFALAARKLGAEFLVATEVKGVEVEQGKVTSVVAEGEKIKTEIVVNAAGAWSPEIGKMLGLRIPVRPQRGQIMISELLPLNRKWRYILDADYLTTAFDREKAGKSGNVRLRLGVAGSYTQGKSGNWTIASSRDFAGYDTKVTMQTLSYISGRVLKFMPKFKEVNFIRAFAGFRPFCYADGLPILGKVNNPAGFVIATGHAGEGVTLAPITGKLIAELITRNETSMPINAFAFSRLQGQ